MKQRDLELSVLGGTALVAACVPKVPATIVSDETRELDPGERVERPNKPGPDRMPPEVLRVEFVGGDRLRIYFSEPIVVSEQFDPRDFRLSSLHLYLYQQVAYSHGYYHDVGHLHYGTPLVFSNAQVRQAMLELDFAPEIEPWLCEYSEYEHIWGDSSYDVPNLQTVHGLFLHYAAQSIPIRDEAGNPLANFGAQWVVAGRGQAPQPSLHLSGPSAAAAGKNLVRIACQPELPPGPR